MPPTLLNRKFASLAVVGILLVLILTPLAFVGSLDSVRGQAGDDHSDSFAGATPISLGGSVAGRVDTAEDLDFFVLDLSTASGTTDVWLYSTGRIDTLGALLDSSGNILVRDDDGNVGLSEERRNFHIRWNLSAGVYFIAVIGYGDTVGDYELHVRAATDPGGISLSSAPELPLASLFAGTIDSANQQDYYRINLTNSKSLAIDALGLLMFDGLGERLPFLPVDLKVFNSRGNEIPLNAFGNRVGVRIRDDFPPGSYFVKVEVPDEGPYFPLVDGSYPVPYILQFYEDEAYTNWFDECEDTTDRLVNSSVEDPLYGCQWHLKNLEPGGHDIDVESVWEEGYEGEGVNVVVVDTTIDHRHEDLTDNFDPGSNHDFGGEGGAFRRFEHHGTNVAGVIGARDNQFGVRGVAPRANLYGHNLLSSDEIFDAYRADAMSRGSLYTAVSNNSWGPPDGHDLGFPAGTFWESAVQTGVKEGYGGKGTFYVFAAGNGGDEGDDANLDELANYYAVTAVCAVSDEDVRVVYSEVGANLWVCAPSLDLPPEESRGIVTTENSDRYNRYFNGTSASAPIVSGVAALLREANPELTWRDLKLILAASARKNDPGNLGWEDGSLKYGSESSADRYFFNYEYGFGMVDAGAALALAQEWETVPPQLMSEAASNGNLRRSIPDASDSGTGTTITERLTLNSPVRFIEYVEIEVDFAHESFRDVEIELESPSGKVSRILAPFDTRQLEEFIPLDGKMRFGSAKHLGEDPNGEWTLRVRDHFGEKDGILRSWKVKAYGHDPESSDPCGQSLSGDGDTSGEWSSDCTSEVRRGSYAKYYSFTVEEGSEVTVRLESDTDPYLYLRAGEARSGTLEGENDDHEGSQGVSQISQTLSAGSYTIEATTYDAGATGSFTLSISGLGTGTTTPPVTDGETSDPCGQSLSGDGDTSGEWSSDCTSEVRRGELREVLQLHGGRGIGGDGEAGVGYGPVPVPEGRGGEVWNP